jgi:transposase InsO family protein
VEPRKSRYLSRSVACWRARIRVLERLRTTRGLTLAVQADNGPELRGRTLDHWAYEHGVQLQFIEPGKPVQNTHIESFNARLRDECPNEHVFLTLDDARQASRDLLSVRTLCLRGPSGDSKLSAYSQSRGRNLSCVHLTE